MSLVSHVISHHLATVLNIIHNCHRIDMLIIISLFVSDLKSSWNHLMAQLLWCCVCTIVTWHVVLLLIQLLFKNWSMTDKRYFKYIITFSDKSGFLVGVCFTTCEHAQCKCDCHYNMRCVLFGFHLVTPSATKVVACLYHLIRISHW